MKNRKYYSSYSQALKRLNLVAGELNRINENEEGVSLYGEQKRFTLKTPKPAVDSMPAPAAEVPSAPPAVPSPALPPSPNAEMPAGDELGMDMGDMGAAPEAEVDVDATVDVETPDMGDAEQVTFKTIQKLTGKLTQKIRTLDADQGMTSEDIKYVINMVLSSLDLKTLTEEDREDILSKFDDEAEDLGGDDMGGLDMTDDSEVEDIQADMDIPVEGYEMEEGGYGNGAIIDSIFGESAIDKVISKYFEISKKEILESKKNKIKESLSIKRQMEEVVKLSETIEQELSSKKFLRENSSSKIIGITNKKNLVFEHNGQQVKISPEGLLV
jgi:hypothetical protein